MIAAALAMVDMRLPKQHSANGPLLAVSNPGMARTHPTHVAQE